MKMHLEQAQSSYKEIADVKRKKHPSFQVGDKVWLLHHNIKTNRPCDKLDYRRIDPFRIEKQINTVAYRLELPASMKIHLVFHALLLEICHEQGCHHVHPSESRVRPSVLVGQASRPSD